MTQKRKPPEQPQIQIKEFSSEEIKVGIQKLKRRIDEVMALGSDRVKYNDQRVDNVVHNIRDAILDIFGPYSPEYNAHKYHSISSGVIYIGKPDSKYQTEFEDHIPQTITMLQGLIARLEEKQADHAGDPKKRGETAFENLELHPRIYSACAELYRDEHFRNAVLDASVALVNMVKEKSRRHDLDGAPLMRTVFSRNDPALAFNDLKDQSDLDEQEGMMHLFEGAVLALRNPRAHTLSDDDPEQALEYIALLSLLAKRLEQSRRGKSAP